MLDNRLVVDGLEFFQVCFGGVLLQVSIVAALSHLVGVRGQQFLDSLVKRLRVAPLKQQAGFSRFDQLAQSAQMRDNGRGFPSQRIL